MSADTVVDKRKSILTDSIIALANNFKEAGYNPPTKIEVDSLTFNKMLSEAAELYTLDSKQAIVNKEFSLSDIITIAESKLSSSSSSLAAENRVEELGIIKYKCPDCEVLFDSKITHRKHQQAFHEHIKEPIEEIVVAKEPKI
jgi:L-lactate utilization protein LutC